MTRPIVTVGDLITAEDLNKISNAGVRTFRNAEELAASTDTVPLRTLAVLIDEQQLLVRYFDADNNEAWVDLTALSASDYDNKVASRNVPEEPISWHTPVGAKELADVVYANLRGDWRAKNNQLFTISETTGTPILPLASANNQLDYKYETDNTLQISSNADVQLILVGGGGSGSGCYFASHKIVNEISYPYAPTGGGGGGGGEIVSVLLKVRLGDELKLVVGGGGIPSEIPLNVFDTQAKSNAGSDTILFLNGVEVARACGGSGGSNTPNSPLEEILADSNFGASFGRGSGGGGGIVASTSDEYAAGATSHVPNSWQPLNLFAPIKARRRGGNGVWLPAGRPYNSTGEDANNQQWLAYAGGGGGESDGLDGLASTASTGRPSPQASTASFVLRWRNLDETIGGGGGGGVLGSTSTMPEEHTGRTETGAGNGGGGGGSWHTTGIVTNASEAWRLYAPAAGTDGAIYLRHSKPAHKLVVHEFQQNSWLAKQFHPSVPLAPEVRFNSAAAVPSLSNPLQLRIIPRGKDYGDVTTAWVLRRRIGSGRWEYYVPNMDSDITTDEWVRTETDNTRRQISASDTSGVLWPTLNPGWGRANETIIFEAKTFSGTLVSPWGRTGELTPVDETGPRQPVLTSVPEPGDYDTAKSINSGDNLVLSWAHTSSENAAQVGIRLFRLALGIGDNVQSLTVNSAGNYTWNTGLQAELNIFDADPAGTIIPGELSGTGIADDNWLALTSNSVTLPSQVWNNFGRLNVDRYLFCVSIVTRLTSGLTQSVSSNAISVSPTVGQVRFQIFTPDSEIPLRIGGESRDLYFSVSPGDAVVTATSSDDLFGLNISRTLVLRYINERLPGLTDVTVAVTPPPTDKLIYQSVIKVTASHPNYSDAAFARTYFLDQADDLKMFDFIVRESYDLIVGQAADLTVITFQTSGNTNFRPDRITYSSAQPNICAVTVREVTDPYQAQLQLTPAAAGVTSYQIAAHSSGYETVHKSGSITVHSTRPLTLPSDLRSTSVSAPKMVSFNPESIARVVPYSFDFRINPPDDISISCHVVLTYQRYGLIFDQRFNTTLSETVSFERIATGSNNWRFNTNLVFLRARALSISNREVPGSVNVANDLLTYTLQLRAFHTRMQNFNAPIAQANVVIALSDGAFSEA